MVLTRSKSGSRVTAAASRPDTGDAGTDAAPYVCTQEQLWRRIYMHNTNPFGFLWIVVMLTIFYKIAQAAHDGPVLEDPPFHAAKSCIIAALVSVPIFYHTYVFPVGTREDDPVAWAVMAVLGRWAFLTRWVLTLHFFYAVASFQAEVLGGAEFRNGMYAITSPIAGFACFVSIQYYTLVYGTKPSLHINAVWKSRGVDSHFISNVNHAISGPLALVDIFFVKDPALLAATRPAPLTMAIILLFLTSTYMLMTRWNYNNNGGNYPYSVMNGCKSLPQFVTFGVIQTGILGVFVVLVVGLQVAREALLVD